MTRSQWRLWLDELGSASLRRASTGCHRSGARAAGLLTVDQRGLFDGVLVDDGGHKHDGLPTHRKPSRVRLASCLKSWNFHLSIVSGHLFNACSASVLHRSQAESSWWMLAVWGGWASSTEARGAHRITVCFSFARRGSFSCAAKTLRQLSLRCVQRTACARACASSCARDPCGPETHR